MTVGRLLSQSIEKGATHLPLKFKPEEIQVAEERARIIAELAITKNSPNGYGKFVKKATVDPFVNVVKAIKKGVVNYFEGVKLDFAILAEQRKTKKEEVATLKTMKTEVMSNFKKRIADTLADNSRIQAENTAFETAQATELAAKHAKNEDYYANVSKLVGIEDRKIAIKNELIQLEKEKAETHKYMNKNFPNPKKKA